MASLRRTSNLPFRSIIYHRKPLEFWTAFLSSSPSMMMRNVQEVAVGMKGGPNEDPEVATMDRPYKGAEVYPDFFYRTPCIEYPRMEIYMTKFLSALLWGWAVYNFYYHSNHLFGDYYVPMLEEFTDEELGIPPDDAPDPEYWGDHPIPYNN